MRTRIAASRVENSDASLPVKVIARRSNTRRPLMPSVTSSARPPMRVPITGVPTACASMATVGPPSATSDGQQSRSSSASAFGTAACGMAAQMLMRGSRPISFCKSSTTRCSPGVNTGPMISARNGRSAGRLVSARTRPSMPLIGSKRPKYARRSGSVVGRVSGPGLGVGSLAAMPRRLTATFDGGAPLAITVRPAQSVSSTKRSTDVSRRCCRAC